MPAYQSWVEIYREHGQDLTRETWSEHIGRESRWFEPAAHLESLVEGPFDRAALQARRDARKTELVAALETMAGVRARGGQGARTQARGRLELATRLGVRPPRPPPA